MLGFSSYSFGCPLQTLRELDHRDGTNIRLLRQEVAKELTELSLAQGDHGFFLLDAITLLPHGGDQSLLQGDHLRFLIDQQPLAGNLMRDRTDGWRRHELRLLQRQGYAGGVASHSETLWAQVVADGVLHRVVQDDGGVRLDAQR